VKAVIRTLVVRPPASQTSLEILKIFFSLHHDDDDDDDVTLRSTPATRITARITTRGRRKRIKQPVSRAPLDARATTTTTVAVACATRTEDAFD